MTKRIALVALALLVVIVGIRATDQSEEASASSTETARIARGDVTVTVGGIGNVATLTEAARLAVPIASTSGAETATAPARPAEAVFSPVSGHVTELLVHVGDDVLPGQPVARLADNGETRTSLIQARHDLAAARLDLAQKLVQDPARGLPPTAAELAHARRAVQAARANLDRLTGTPLPAELAAARLELARARAELHREQSVLDAQPAAVTAAQLAVDAAQHRVDQLTGAPDPAELAAARLEVAQAQVDLESLTRSPAPPSAAEIAAADAAVSAARERLSAVQSAGDAAAVATAEAELARAIADRAALDEVASAPTAGALTAARLAVDAAQSRLDQLLRPPAAAVSAARSELAKAQADLSAAQSAAGARGVESARAAVGAARATLRQLLDPSPEAVTAARADVARAGADLAVLRQRGSPASRTDLSLARLRVTLARQQVELARLLIDRLTVRASHAGTVTSLLTSTGAPVDASTPLLRVQDLDGLVIRVNLTEFDVGRTSVGAPARVRADALGGRPYAGTVSDVALSGNDTGGVVTFPVIVAVDDADGLRPGMSVSVRIVVAHRADVLVVPLDAIEDREGRSATVLVRTGRNQVEEREIRLGLVGSSTAEVVDGLRAGERVVVGASDEA